MKFNLEVCPRCGAAHADLPYKPLKNPTAFCNVYLTCPDTKEPIIGVISLTVQGDGRTGAEEKLAAPQES